MSAAMGAYEFAAAFRVLRVEAASGRVFAPGRPIDVKRIVGLNKLAANRQFEPLLDFEWAGPEPWMMRLSTLDAGRAAAFVFLHESGRSTRAIAAVIVRDRRRIFAEFFRSLLTQNGAGYGVPLFGSLPLQTLNHAPDVIGAEVVRESYLKWVEWAEALGADPWAQIEARVLEGARTVPDGRRPARIARRDVSPTDFAQEMVRRARAEPHAEARRSLLRLYLSVTYSEAGG